MADLADIGLYGLAVMGQNFALNMAEHGFSVSVANRSPEKVLLRFPPDSLALINLISPSFS
jgi:6-phosphogluconate dehydrogenase